MGDIHDPLPVQLLVAASSRYEEALVWGLRECEAEYGPAAAASPAFDFAETNYYDAEMGVGLKKQFWVFEQLVDPGRLPAIKRQTNFLEAEYTGLKLHAEPRPLNLHHQQLLSQKIQTSLSRLQKYHPLVLEF